MNKPRELILAIAANDKALHVGPVVDLGAHFVGLRPGRRPPPPVGGERLVDPAGDDVGVFIDPNPDDDREPFDPGRGTEPLVDLDGTEHERPRPVLWDFFDSTGRVLTRAQVEHPETFVPADPTVPDEVVDQQLILLRIARVLGYFQALLDADPRLGQIGFDVFVTEIPHPRGTLAEVMDQLAPEFGLLNPHQMGNQGGWLHMLAHAARVAH